MVSFQQKLAAGLDKRGVGVCYSLDDHPYRSVLVIGGTRDLKGLWRARKRGIPVVQRLDGMNWLHRRLGLRAVGLRHYLRSEYGNALLGLIRGRFADRIVYQSEFSRRWWEESRGRTRVEARVIYNGVDLEAFNPVGEGSPPADRWRVLMVEGSLMGGYEHGLSTAVNLMQRLAAQLNTRERSAFPGVLELAIAGRVSEAVKTRWEAHLAGEETCLEVNWVGLVPHAQIPSFNRSAHLLYSADINPACPNSVIEALACGLPVVAFATGALLELVEADAGAVVPYGGDPWKLDPPDTQTLAQEACRLLDNLGSFRRGARQRAVSNFGLDQMVDSYLDVLLDG
jgi:glycosyltransferase involved in cell wall biosynthesis